jgi:hypothetical protein
MLTFHMMAQKCGFVQTCARPISEEADRLNALSSAQKHQKSAPKVIDYLINAVSGIDYLINAVSGIDYLINAVSESGWAATIEREFIDGSAISPNLFETAIDIVQDTGYWEPNELLGQSVSRQWQTYKPHSYGALAVFLNEDRSPWQAKPQNPRIDKKGKAQRYESIKDNGSRAFLPVVPPEIRVKISQRYGVRVPSIGSFWTWLESHPEIPIILTEGGKKSLCLLSQGYVAIALYGVDGGGLFNEWINGEKLRRLKPELIADLQPFAVSGRPITLAFDQDESAKTRSQVNAALDRLGGLLRAAGCTVSIAQWDGQTGRCKGVDDLIVNEGVEAWEKALSEAVSFSQWSIARQLAHEVRRKPDLNIKDREFIEVASELPKSGIVALYGGKGSGKSKAIGELLKGQKWISITHSTAVGRDQAAWGGVFINDGDRHGSKLLKDGVPVDGGSVCVPSLLKVSAVQADVLVLDEITATLEFLLGSKLANKDGIRPLLLSEFCRRVQSARLVLIADADLTEESLQFIETIRGGRAYLVRSERTALTYEATIIDGTKNEAIALLQERISNAPENKIIYINADSKAYAETLAEILGRDLTLLITSDTSGGEVEASLLTSKGRDLPALVARGIRFIVSSPSIVQGFSFEKNTNLIDSVWGFYSGCSISAHSIAQAPDRVRDSIPRFFSIPKKGSATSRLSKAQTIPTFLKEFKQLHSTAARLVANSLTPDVAPKVEGLNWQNQNLKMLAAIETRRNRGMFALRETLIALLKKEGKRVTILRPQFSKAEIRAIGALVNGASDAVKNRHYDAVAASETITKETATVWAEQSDPLTPEQGLSLEKFYISEFYRLETVSPLDVKFDRNRRTRSQIKALEAVLFPQVATETTAKSINQNPENPQDWNPLVVQVWLLAQSTAAALIRGIVSGEIEKLTPDVTAPIAGFFRNHPTEFKRGFNFRNVESLSDQQIIGEILSRHGIKTKLRGKGINKRYEVCKPELEAILSIIERRKNEVLPPLDQRIDQGGKTQSKAPENLEKWLTPKSLNEIREQIKLANIPEEREALRQVIPIEVLERAIA